MRQKIIPLVAVTAVALGLLVGLPVRSLAIDPDQLHGVPPKQQLVRLVTTANRVVTVDLANPGILLGEAFMTGFGGGEALVGADVRPTNGAVYAVTVDAGDVGRLYTVDPRTGVAVRVATITGATLTGTSFAVDFDPVAGQLRVIGDDDQNLRVNVEDGTAATGAPLAYRPADANIGANPEVTGAGATNPFAGARSSTMYVVDSALDTLAVMTTPDGGQLSTVGSLGVDIGAANGFDVLASDQGIIASSGSPSANGPQGGPNLFIVDLAVGGATLVGSMPPIAGAVTGLGLVPSGYRIPGGGTPVGLSPDGRLLQLDGGTQVVSAQTAISGTGTDTIVAIDFRPANGRLYGLGRQGNLYVIDVAGGVASRINRIPFNPPLAGTSFGFDVDPVTDQIRVTSDTGQDLRLDPNIGVVVSEDPTLRYPAGDPNAGPGSTAGAAYTDSVPGSSTTELFVIDSTRSVLAEQDPQNTGTLRTVGPLGLTVGTSNVGFDVVAGTNRAVALLETAGAGAATSDALYTVDLGTGRARLIGRLPVDAVDVAVPGDGQTGLGYHLVASDGGVFSYGSARFAGSAGALKLVSPIVGMAERPAGPGYWLAAADGGVFSYGTGFFGSMAGRQLSSPIIGVVAHPSGSGYWLYAADGGVFAFGLARFAGSAGALPLQKPIVAMAATPTGLGYWLFASDGGVFAYGDAGFFGSQGGTRLNQPIVAAAGAPSGQGYLLGASDGGVFGFGPGAPFRGSAGGTKLVAPVVGMDADPDGSGYALVARDGGVFTYDFVFSGSAGAVPLAKPIVGMATR